MLLGLVKLVKWELKKTAKSPVHYLDNTIMSITIKRLFARFKYIINFSLT